MLDLTELEKCKELRNPSIES